MKQFLALSLFFFCLAILGQQEPYHTSCTFSVTLSEDNYIYADTISISVDHPAIVLEDYTTNPEPTEQYDSLFKENKSVLSGTISFHIPIIILSYPYEHAHIYIQYYQKSHKKFVQHFLPVNAKPLEKHSTTISVEKNKKFSPLLYPKKSLSLFPSWWDDMYAIWFFLLEKYSYLILIWWILIGLLLYLTPLVSPTLTLTTQTLLKKKERLSFFQNSAYIIFQSLLILIYCNIVIFIMPHIQNYPLWYLHTTYSFALIILGVYLLKWHVHVITFLKNKHIFILCKKLFAFLFLTLMQTLCLYPIAYLIVDSTQLYYALLVLYITSNIPFYMALKWHQNAQFEKLIQSWSQEAIIALGYTCIYATFFIWYYTKNISKETGLALAASTSVIIGIWYIIHAKSIQTFWRYIARIIGIGLCASSPLISFYSYKLYYPIKKAPNSLVLKK